MGRPTVVTVVNGAVARRAMEKPARGHWLNPYLKGIMTSSPNHWTAHTTSTTTPFTISGQPTTYTITYDMNYTTVDAQFVWPSGGWPPPTESIDTRVGKSWSDSSEWSR